MLYLEVQKISDNAEKIIRRAGGTVTLVAPDTGELRDTKDANETNDAGNTEDMRNTGDTEIEE